MNRNKVLIALVFILVIVVAVQTAFIVGRNSVEDTPAVVEQEDTTEVEEVAPVEETPKFVSKFSKYAISHADYQLTDDNYVYCLSDKTKKRITNSFTVSKPYKRQFSCIQHRTYVQREIINESEIIQNNCMGVFTFFYTDSPIARFLNIDVKNLTCSYQTAQQIYNTLSDRISKVENKKLKLSLDFARSLGSTESYLTKISDMYLLETKKSDATTNWMYCDTRLRSEVEQEFYGWDHLNDKVLSEYHARFIKTVNKLATNQLQREVNFEQYYRINFSKHGLVVQVHDIGDEDSCNYQFVYLPYEEFDKAWFYPEDVKVLKNLGYVPLLW